MNNQTTQHAPAHQYRYLHFLMMLFITLFLICDTTAFRMTRLFGTTVPVSGLIIPLAFALGDLIADVYGYTVSRKLIWNAMACQFIFAIGMTLAVNSPSPEGDLSNLHYSEAFQHIIRTSLTGTLGITCGMFANVFIMSKLKIWMNGHHFWMRTIISSSMSEFILCLVTSVSLYAGLKNPWEIWAIVLSIWYYKLIFAVLAAPLVSILAHALKKHEHCDVFDYGINYNPFHYHEQSTR